MNVRPVVTDVHLVVTDVSHTGLPHGTTKAREKETDDGRWGREGKEGGEREKLKEKTHLARCVELVAQCLRFKFIQSQEDLDNILLIDFIKKTIFYISGQMSMYKNTQEFMLNSTPFDVIDMMVDYFYSC